MAGESGEIQPFDYSTLTDPDDRTWLRERTESLSHHLRCAAEEILKAGRILCQVRGRLKRGQFIRWLETEFPGSRMTAWRRMAAWESIENVSCRDTIAPELLAYLCAPSMPHRARKQIMTRIESGEDVTLEEARAIASAYRSVPAKKVKATIKALPKEEASPSVDELDESALIDMLAARGVVSIETITVTDEESGREQELIKMAVSGSGVKDLALTEAVAASRVEAARLLLGLPEEIRRCTRCGELKGLSQFSRLKEGKSGRNGSCKQCESKRALDHHYQSRARKEG